jgi:hypothetical protein
VRVVWDCPNATVEVRLPVDAMDPAAHTLPNDTVCDAPDGSSKESDSPTGRNIFRYFFRDPVLLLVPLALRTR